MACPLLSLFHTLLVVHSVVLEREMEEVTLSVALKIAMACRDYLSSVLFTVLPLSVVPLSVMLAL